MGFENNDLIISLENDRQALRAALQKALDFAASGQIPKPRTQKAWTDLITKTRIGA
jgi:hypothetical protein